MHESSSRNINGQVLM